MAKPNLEGVQVVTKSVMDLTKDEYGQCMRLGYRQGAIRARLRSLRRLSDRLARVVFVKVRDTIAAWALTYHGGGGYGNWHAMFWTRTAYRKMGLGKLMAEGVKRVAGADCAVYFYEQPEFFRKMGFSRSVY